jgi:glycogen(starch) synthase
MAGKAPKHQRTRPPRILMTADAVGGVWQYTTDLVKGLAERSTNVLVAVLGPGPTEEQRAELAGLPSVTIAEAPYKLEWMDSPWDDVDLSGRWLLDLQSSFGADVIHLNGYSHASLPWRKPVVAVAHSCVYSWWNSTYGCSPGNDWAEYKRRVTEGLAACQAIVAPSRFMAGEVCREYEVSAAKIRVIYNFSTAAAAPPSGEKELFCLGAGRLWDPAKNFTLLEQIARRVPWPIVVAGNNEKGLEASGSSIDLIGQLRRQEMADLMTRASVFVHPALYEPFGLVVLEAARAGCCLVLSDLPSLRELWDGAALFVDPRQPEQWISALKRIAAAPEECTTMAARAAQHAKRYSAEAAMEAYLTLYRELTERSESEAAA